MKKLLLTGASGFLGKHTMQLLNQKQYEVHAVSRSDHRGAETKLKNVHYHKCDLLNFKQLEQLLCKIKATHLLHYAWYVEHKKFWTAQENMGWVAASINLIQQFSYNGGKRVVISGTCAEYDWSNEYLSEKTTPLSPTTAYGMSKKALYELVGTFAPNLNLSFAWGRLFFLYGPHEAISRLVPSAIISLLNDRSFQCSSEFLERDFLYVEDAANAFLSLLDSTIEGPVNIALGKSFKIKHIVSTIGKILNKEKLIEFNSGGNNAGQPISLKADTTRLHEELKFSARYELESGLEKTIEWFKKY